MTLTPRVLLAATLGVLGLGPVPDVPPPNPARVAANLGYSTRGRRTWPRLRECGIQKLAQLARRIRRGRRVGVTWEQIRRELVRRRAVAA